jgi:ABC-type transporter Mla MlaB component
MSNHARPPGAPARSASLTIVGPLACADLRSLCAQIETLMAGGRVEVLCCELVGVRADAVSLDALARLALVARRRGARVRLEGATRELRELVDLAGLGDVLGGGW